MTRSDEDRVGDIRAAIQRTLAYRGHLDSPEMGLMAYDAILRNLAVIGEAVRSLPPEFQEQRPDTPWASIAGLRNVVVHEYFRVNREVILDILDNHLPALDQAITQGNDD